MKVSIFARPAWGPRSVPIKLYSFDEVLSYRPEQREVYIEGMLYEGQTAVLHGPSGHGKSYFTAFLAALMSAGGDVDDILYAPKPRKVAYLQAEATVFDFRERVEPPVRVYGWGQKVRENFAFGQVSGVDLTRRKETAALESAVGDYDVVFLDTLSAFAEASANDDDAMGKVEDWASEVHMRHPKVALVFIHHDHRNRRDSTGKLIDEGDDTFSGSHKVKAMADQMWQYRISGGVAKFHQTKSRSRLHRIPDFTARLDDESGLLTFEREANGPAVLLAAVRRKGRLSPSDLKEWTFEKKVSERTVARYIKELRDLGSLHKEGEDIVLTTG